MSGSAIFDVKLNTLHGGTGINFGYDQAGPGRTFTVNANYSYHINLQNDRVLSLGVSGGLSLANIDFSQIDMDDDQVIVSDVNYKLYHFKFGLFYASNHLDFGLSSTHVKVPEMLNADSRIINNYWMFCSYQFDIGENFGIKPNLLMRTPSNKMDVTLSSGLLMIYKERFWTGLSYTIDRSVGAVVGYDIKGMIRIGYSFNYSAYPYNKYSYGIHEIIFGLKIR
jgi:type IX secretion system PorP/SprF family membrane protein